MALVASSQSNKALKFFSSKLYMIRARPLDFLIQNVGPFTTPNYNPNMLGSTEVSWRFGYAQHFFISQQMRKKHFCMKPPPFNNRYDLWVQSYTN